MEQSCKKQQLNHILFVFSLLVYFPSPTFLSFSFLCTFNPVFLNVYWHCLVLHVILRFKDLSDFWSVSSKSNKIFNLFCVLLLRNSQMYSDFVAGIFQNESLIISDEMFPFNCGVF